MPGIVYNVKCWRKINGMWGLPYSCSQFKEKIEKQLKLYIEKGLNNSSLERSEKFKGSVQFELYFALTCLTQFCPLKFRFF